MGIKELENINLSNFKSLELVKQKVNLKLKMKKTIYPILTTHYEREYFISRDKHVRATVDYNLKSLLPAGYFFSSIIGFVLEYYLHY